jgi:hypothetical protein
MILGIGVQKKYQHFALPLLKGDNLYDLMTLTKSSKGVFNVIHNNSSLLPNIKVE